MKWFYEQLKARQQNDETVVKKVYADIEDRLVHPRKVKYKKEEKESGSIGTALKYAFSFMKPIDHILVILFTISFSLLGLLQPELIFRLVSDVTEEASLSKLKVVGIMLISITVGVLVLNVFKELVGAFVTLKVSAKAESKTFKRTLSLKTEFFREHTSSEIAMCIDFIKDICSTSIQVVYCEVADCIFSLVYIYEIIKYAPSLLPITLAIPVVYIFASIVLFVVRTRYIKSYLSSSLEEEGFSGVLLGAIQKIRVTGSEHRAFAEWGKRYQEVIGIKYNPPILVKLSNAILQAIMMLGVIVMFYTAYNKNMDSATMYTVSIAFSMIVSSFVSFGGIVEEASSLNPLMENVSTLLNAEEEEAEERESKNTISGAIKVSNVNFSYGERQILNDLSFEIKPGQYVGFTGPSGCGKSTIIKLLLGFERAASGNIYYDDKEINEIDLQSLRQKLGIVLQDSRLFIGSIKENISMSDPDMSDETIWDAAESANIAEDIRNMPMGMESLITEGSGGISGGQRQRIMIARAIACSPNVLYFDEATSALDNISQKKVIEALDSMKCTRVVIAHRLSTIKHCDRIFYIEDGKIVEDGDYESLMKLNGKFASMVQRQLY